MNLSPNKLSALLSLMLLSLASVAVALPNDREQAAVINANTLESDIKKGINIYTGDVVIVQGSLKISAERVEIFTNKNNEIERILATSRNSLSKFQQRPSLGKPLVKATSKTIDYKAKKNLIHLIDQAVFEQVGSTKLTGDKINYDIATSFARASGDQSNGKKNRIQMVIQPKALDKK